MGGAACAIPHLAIMADNVIPTDPAKLPEFDEKLRLCCAQSEIVFGLLTDELYDQACAILKKARGTWTTADRTALKGLLDSLYK